MQRKYSDALSLSQWSSLADEARSYTDLALRPRVLSLAADILWNADRDAALVLFRRAWEAAEKGDAEEVTIKTKDNRPQPKLIRAVMMVGSLRRLKPKGFNWRGSYSKTARSSVPFSLQSRY